MSSSGRTLRIGLILAAVLAFVTAACHLAGGAQENAGDKQWFKGNLHTHSLWKGGDDYPEVIIDWYRRHGYDFVALSDHNTIAEEEKWVVIDRPKMQATYDAYVDRFGDGWVDDKHEDGELMVRLKTFDEYRSLLEEPSRFLIIRSEEISDRFDKRPVHVNATNISEFIEPRGGVSVREVMQNNVDAVLEQRERTGRPMIPHVNHPNFRWAVTAEDIIALQGERFFEVYNGHPLVHNHGNDEYPSTERIWDIVLAKRLSNGDEVMYGLATDDAHRYQQFDSTQSNPGRGWVMVHAASLTPEAIIAAMEAGDFYASTGVQLEDVQRGNGRISLRIDAEPGVEYVTQFIGTRKGYDSTSVPVPPQPGERHRRSYSEDIGEVLAEVEGTEPSYRLKGDEIYVRANVISSKSKENAVHASEVEEAWIQPLVPEER